MRNHEQLLQIACLAAAVVAQACSSSPEDEPETDRITQADTATWNHPGCSADDLAPPFHEPNHCNGPWTYSYTEWWKDRAACGNSAHCNRYNSCISWDKETPGDGLGFVPTSASTSTTHSYSCAGGRHPCPPSSSQDPGTVCKADRDAWRLQLIADRPGMSGPAKASFTADWTFKVLSVEIEPEPPQGGGAHASTTTYECDLTTSTYPKKMEGERAACGCAEFEPNECVRTGPIKVFTDPNSLLPGTPGTPLPGSTRRDFASERTCTTCDALVINNPVAAQTTFNCLDKNLADISSLTTAPVGSVAPSDVVASIAARMELMLHLAGDKLTADQRSRAEQIYNEHPTAAPVCRQPVAFTPACSSEAAPLQLPGQLQLCQDLLSNANTTREVAGLELSHCLDQLNKVDQLTTQDCRLTTRDAADSAIRGVLARAQPDYTGDLATALPNALGQINNWWSAAQVVARSDDRWLFERSSGVARTLWQSLELARLPHSAGSPPGLPRSAADDAAAIALLADVSNTGLDNDTAMLNALFADSEEGASPVLLTLTGDSLRALNDRLSHLKPVADVGCRFAGCKPKDDSEPLRSSALSELVHALAVLPDPVKLGQVLASASKLQQQQGSLHGALSALQARHARLATAWTALGRTEPFKDLAKVVDPPAEAAELAKIVREASVAWSSYSATGEFDPRHRPRLTAATLEQNALVANIDGLIFRVNTAKNTYSTARLQIVNDVLAQIQNSQAAQTVRDRNSVLRTQYNDVLARQLGIENAEANARMTMATFQQAFESVASTLSPDAVFKAQPLTTLFVSAGDAKYPIGQPHGDVVRDRFHVETLQTGEALRFHITDAWSPTCAIVRATLTNPETGEAVGIAIPHEAATGPTGYWAGFETNTYMAHTEGSQWLQRLDVGASAEICSGAQVLGSGARACAHINLDEIWENSEGDSNGNQTRASASFASGLRLSTTPYPVAPAGSLVAVLTRTHGPQTIIDTRVVQSDDVIIAPALPPGVDDTIDVHLVVNDATDNCLLNLNQKLQIEMVRTTPQGNVSRALGKAMSSTLTALEAGVPAILAQGQLTANDAIALRSNAWLEVQQDLNHEQPGMGLSGLPADLHQLFEAFLDLEINSISRRGDMHALALQADQLLLEFAANADELHFNDQRSQLTFLIPRWRLRDLSGEELSFDTSALVQSLTSHVAPIFELRAPAQFTTFPDAIQLQLNKLIDLSVTGRLEDQISNLTSFATTLRDAVSDAPFEVPDVDRHVLIAALPRPPTPDIQNPLSPPWHHVTDATANAFWTSAIDDHGNLQHAAKLTLSPRDLYVYGGNPGTLACSANTESDVAPVIRRAAIYLDTQSPSTGSLGTSLPARAAGFADVTFPLVGGSMILASDDPRGVPMPLPVLAGGADQAIDKFAPPNTPDPGLGAGAGLSPFTSFEIDMTSLASLPQADVFKNTQAIYIMFLVEARQSLDLPDVEGVCTMR